ncbi:MAG: DNA adenine methylase [Candidatus Marinimicrobia bacterium]|nr:DNA adenine methylase [Candidatus Neomarinimicrobiota bacterium]
MDFFSPLRYPGGKTRLSYFLQKAIEENFIENNKIVLVEPYAGGAGASLKLLYSGKVKKIIINDLDKAIYSFWKTATEDTDYLIRKIKSVIIDIDEWKKQKKIFSNPSTSIKKLAFATLFLNRTNYSGIIKGGPIGGVHQSGFWNVRSRFNKDLIIKRLNLIKEHKNSIGVRNYDGIYFLKRLEKNKKKDDYFIFIDPPYYKKGKSLYLNHYIDKNHEKLSKFLEKTPLKWVMTYDDVLFIRKLYRKMRKTKFVINHSAYRSKMGKEILIYSDKIAKIAVKF